MKYSRAHKFFVYAILDTRKPGPFYYGHWKFDYEPIYIGKGMGNRHLYTLRENSHSPFKTNKLNKIRREGLEPILVFKRAKLTEKQAFDLEIRLICIVGRYPEGPLTNTTEGGEGCSGRVLSSKTKQKISKAHTGKTHSLETRKRISEAKKNPSAATRRKISKALSERVYSKETLRRRSVSISRSRTPELRAQISAALMGRPKPPRSKQYRINMSVAKRNISDATRNKMRQARLGKTLDPVTRTYV